MTYTDIRKLPWIERLPEKTRPFLYLMRLDRPIGTWLLLLPALWSIFLAGDITTNTIRLTVLFSVGAVVMRGAGCVINDLWDRDIDRKVERTRSRPLASGAISPKQAVIFLTGLLSIGFLILLQMNMVTIILGIMSLLFIVTYPLMKRITWWPQAFLGLTFNFGALMGWSAVTGTIEVPAILLYIGGIFWTLGYDTIYACQDKEDDALAGVKSTARLFENNVRGWVSGFYGLSFFCLMGAVYLDLNTLWSLLCLPAFIVIAFQVKTFVPNNAYNCLKNFRLNREFGLIFLAGIVLATM